VIRDLLPRSLCEISGGGDAGHLCSGDYDTIIAAAIIFGVAFPLTCLPNLSALRHTAMLSFAFAVLLTVSVVVRSTQSFNGKSAEGCKPLNLFPYSPTSVFRALPIFSFSFVCHLNVLPVYEELRSGTPSRTPLRSTRGRAHTHTRAPYNKRFSAKATRLSALVAYASARVLPLHPLTCAPSLTPRIAVTLTGMRTVFGYALAFVATIYGLIGCFGCVKWSVLIGRDEKCSVLIGRELTRYAGTESP